MFKNLKAEMARQGITLLKVSEDLQLSYESVRNKFNGKTEFLRSEMLRIRDMYFPDCTLDYLFANQIYESLIEKNDIQKIMTQHKQKEDERMEIKCSVEELKELLSLRDKKKHLNCERK